LTELAEKLLEQEVIFKEDLELIFGKRPWQVEEQLNIQKDEVLLVQSEDVSSTNDSEIVTIEDSEAGLNND